MTGDRVGNIHGNASVSAQAALSASGATEEACTVGEVASDRDFELPARSTRARSTLTFRPVDSKVERPAPRWEGCTVQVGARPPSGPSSRLRRGAGAADRLLIPSLIQ